MIKLLITLIILLSSCSTVSEELFLNQVKGKIVYDTDKLITKRGDFSSDGKEFRYVGGSKPFKLFHTINENTAYYVQRYVGIHIKTKFSINQNELTIHEENGQPTVTVYLD